MRKLLLIPVMFLLIFIVAARNRVYIRDPFGAFYLSEVRQDGMKIFINYSNEVLVMKADGTQEYLIQAWDNSIPGKPEPLPCLMNLVCVARLNHAEIDSWSGARKAFMTNRQVTFTDGNDKPVRIVLR